MIGDGVEGRHPVPVSSDRAIARPAYRPMLFAEVEDTPTWWKALGLLGAAFAAAGALAEVGAAAAIAIGGLVLFLGTAVVAGAERWEVASSLAVAGIVWSSVGISLASGGDGAPGSTAIALAASGLVLLAVGLVGLARTGPR